MSITSRILARHQRFLERKVNETLTGALPPPPCVCPAFCSFCVKQLEHDWLAKNGAVPMTRDDLEAMNVPAMYARTLVGA